jgi:hypothetical protein
MNQYGLAPFVEANTLLEKSVTGCTVFPPSPKAGEGNKVQQTATFKVLTNVNKMLPATR